MVATVSRNGGPEVLTDDLLAEIAEERVRGQSWEAIAAQHQWDVAELRAALRRSPHFSDHLATAHRELLLQVETELLQALRQHLRGDDAAQALEAASTLAKYLTARRRDETRLELAEQKATASPGRAGAARAEPPDEPSPRGWTPDEQAHFEAVFRRNERLRAEQVAREKTTVFLWGGCHKLKDVPPDETDTPLLLLKETLPGRGDIYWAVTNPLPVDDFTNGPFLEPPGCRPPPCPPRDPSEPPPPPGSDPPPGEKPRLNR